MNATATLGFIGGAFFCFAGFPAAWRALKAGSTEVPRATTFSLLAGLAFAYAYLHLTNGFDPVVALMYGTEFVTWLTVARYTLFPRRPQYQPCADPYIEKLCVAAQKRIAETLAQRSPWLDIIEPGQFPKDAGSETGVVTLPTEAEPIIEKLTIDQLHRECYRIDQLHRECYRAKVKEFLGHPKPYNPEDLK